MLFGSCAEDASHLVLGCAALQGFRKHVSALSQGVGRTGNLYGRRVGHFTLKSLVNFHNVTVQVPKRMVRPASSDAELDV